MRIKTLIASRLEIPLLGLRDKHLVARIAEETGWARPSKKDREDYFFKYYSYKFGADAKAGRLPALVKKRQDFVSIPSRTFYQSAEWISLRYQALKKSRGCCECCGATPLSSGKPLHVDHIKPRSKHPHLALELANLQVLCADCNIGKSNKDDTDWRQVA